MNNRTLYWKRYYKENKEKIDRKNRKWRIKNKKRAKKLRREYYLRDKEKVRVYGKQYYGKNKKTIRKKHKRYYLKTKSKRREHNTRYESRRLKTDINFKLRKYLRIYLRQAIQNNQKKGSAIKDLGCSIEFFKQYIESKFYSNMSWSNWGKVWQLDHIKPLASFDFSNRNDLLKAVNYKNMQPLTIEDHREKTAKEIGVCYRFTRRAKNG